MQMNADPIRVHRRQSAANHEGLLTKPEKRPREHDDRRNHHKDVDAAQTSRFRGRSHLQESVLPRDLQDYQDNHVNLVNPVIL